MEDKEVLKDFDDDFALFIEAGFVAVKQLDEKGAKQVFHAAHTLRPDDPIPAIGMGYIALNKLEVKEAAEIFKKVVDKYPDHQLAKTFLGMTYLLSKNKKKEGKHLIKNTMEGTSDETIKNLGNVALEWADRDLEKEQSPFFSPEQEKDE